jgi:predicted GH43/DUF377 family glycosyl hydrolase
VEAIKEPPFCYKYKIRQRHEQNAREAKVEWASHSIQASSGMLYYAADETLLLLLLLLLLEISAALCIRKMRLAARRGACV